MFRLESSRRPTTLIMELLKSLCIESAVVGEVGDRVGLSFSDGEKEEGVLIAVWHTEYAHAAPSSYQVISTRKNPRAQL